MEAVLTGINGMLSLNFLLSVSGCHVYGTFVAAVAIIVSVLAFRPVFNWLSVLVFFVDRVVAVEALLGQDWADLLFKKLPLSLRDRRILQRCSRLIVRH